MSPSGEQLVFKTYWGRISSWNWIKSIAVNQMLKLKTKAICVDVVSTTTFTNIVDIFYRHVISKLS